MSYSTLFTSGLSLASLPRADPVDLYAASARPSLQHNAYLSMPRLRPRRGRRSSLTIAIAPAAGNAKGPGARPAHGALRAAMPGPNASAFVEQPSQRHQSASPVLQPPYHPAPTAPLPTLPPLDKDALRSPIRSSAPNNNTPFDDPCPSSPITSESPWIRSPNTALFPSFGRARSSSCASRGPLSPAFHVAAKKYAEDPLGMEEKDSPAVLWFDDEDEEMKQKDSEA